MGEKVTLTTSDDFAFGAYVARPQGRPRAGVVVIQEVWGVNNWVRGVADRFARHGYLAVAPQMFDRMQRDFESENYGPEHFPIVGELMKGFDNAKAMRDVEAAVKAAAEAGKVGITGYCFGGRMSWLAAHHGLGLSAGSGYYGGGVPNYIALEPRVPLEIHFGDRDKGIPLEQIEELKARWPQVDVYVYAADHGFCNSDRTEKFDEAACKKASARTLDFFRKHLG